MRWQGRRQSSNVEDRRGMSPKGMIGGGVGTLVILVVAYFLGINPDQLNNIIPTETDQTNTSTYEGTAEENQLKEFSSVVLGDTEDVWNQLFRQMGSSYKPAKLVIFSNQVESGCGVASAGSGPFYCPADERVYIDLSFCDELKNRFQAPGDFALAYVIAHEVGHHVQNLLGTSDKVSALRGRLSEREYNKYSVRLELQADFYAGVWAHHAQRLNNILEEGDIEEALNAASAVGDDRIQKQMQGHVVPDAFTHGTSQQRMTWFKKGFTTGDIEQGDTFADIDF
ncbi:MAG: neutral zinc metallopeptidase [bacterium]